VEFFIFIFFSLAAIAAVTASPVSLFKPRRSYRCPSYSYRDERGEILLLNDLHRTTFRRH